MTAHLTSPPIRVVYEGAVFDILRVGGVSRYFEDLIEHSTPSIAPIVVGPSHAPCTFDNPSACFVPIRTKSPIKMLGGWWRRIQSKRIENRIDSISPDLVHWTYYNGLCRRQLKNTRCPSVVTVYDFIHESFPELDPSGAHAEMKRRAIETADRICCISQTTHNELCDRMPHVAAKSTVTMLGNSFANVHAAAIPETLRAVPYILYVGRRQSYKNFDILWDAFRSIRDRCPDLQLVIVGPAIKSAEARSLGLASDDRRIVCMENVSDELLKALYQHSAAFVFPSKKEGFGLPAMEAMQSGANLIISDCLALQEVAGEAAHCFPKADTDSLADLLRLASLSQLPDADRKRAIGSIRAAELTWQRTAETTANVYHELVNVNRARHPIRRAA